MTIHEELQKTKLGPEYAYLLERQPLLGRFFKKLFEVYCKLLFSLYCPLKVEGKENLPDSSFIFCSNHSSHMDTGVLMIASGLPFEKFAMMAAKEYFFDNKTRRIFLNLLMNLIPIERRTNHISLVKSLAACRDFTINGNRNIIIYPEGTRSLSGLMGKFKKGPAMISSELGIPIVPVFISGTYQAYPKGNILMKPHRLRASIGKPIYPEEYHMNNEVDSHKQIYNDIIEEVEKRIHEMANQ